MQELHNHIPENWVFLRKPSYNSRWLLSGWHREARDICSISHSFTESLLHARLWIGAGVATVDETTVDEVLAFKLLKDNLKGNGKSCHQQLEDPWWISHRHVLGERGGMTQEWRVGKRSSGAADLQSPFHLAKPEVPNSEAYNNTNWLSHSLQGRSVVGSHPTKIKLSASRVHLLVASGNNPSPAHLGYWQNPVPGGCRTWVPVFLLAITKDHSQLFQVPAFLGWRPSPSIFKQQRWGASFQCHICDPSSVVASLSLTTAGMGSPFVRNGVLFKGHGTKNKVVSSWPRPVCT